MKQSCVAKIPQPLDYEGNMKQFGGLENCWTFAAHVYENCAFNVLLDQETSYSHQKQKWYYIQHLEDMVERLSKKQSLHRNHFTNQ